MMPLGVRQRQKRAQLHPMIVCCRTSTGWTRSMLEGKSEVREGEAVVAFCYLQNGIIMDSKVIGRWGIPRQIDRCLTPHHF